MKNNYIIVSNDKVNIDFNIQSIIKKINIKDLEIVKFDYPDSTIDNVLEELDSFNLLSNCKLIIYYNCQFLNKEVDKNIKQLKKYLDNPSENYLIMINDSLSEKKDIKELVSNNVVILNETLSSQKIVNHFSDFMFY